MNRKHIILFSIIALLFSSCDYINDLEYKLAITQGNASLKNSDFANAKLKYDEALQINDTLFIAPYNSGIADYAAHNTDSAELDYESALSLSKNDNITSAIYHNYGNVYLGKVRQLTDSTQQQNDSISKLIKESLDKALEKYKQAINANHLNDSAQYNYIYTLNLLKQQEQNQQNRQDNKQDQNQDKDKQKDKQDREDDKKDKQEQENNQKDKNKDDKKEENKSQQASQMSRNQALQDLKNLEAKEKKLLQKINLKKEEGKPVTTDKDW